MSKTSEFIDQERNVYGKIFVDINYAIDNISPFLDKEILNGRKYVVKLPVLKKYIDLLDSAEAESKKGGFLSIFNGDKYIDLLNSYKRDNRETFDRLENCSKCACLNCTSTCKFDSCLGCRNGAKIAKCDHSKINISVFKDYFLDLTNNKTGNPARYMVLATLQDCQKEQKYIIIQNVSDPDDKFILYYYPGISEDTYGEISDEQEFDFIASVYESIDL